MMPGDGTLNAAWVDASHLQACLPGLSRPAAERLRACARLRGRLARLVMEAYAVPSLSRDGLDAPAVRLALASPEAIRAAGRLMGAAWHAGSLRLLVDRGEVNELVARIGAPARLFGLRHAALAATPGEAMAPDDLADAVLRAADTCLASWLAGLPAGAREHAGLKLPRDIAIPTELDSRAAPIVARAAEEILADDRR